MSQIGDTVRLMPLKITFVFSRDPLFSSSSTVIAKLTTYHSNNWL